MSSSIPIARTHGRTLVLAALLGLGTAAGAQATTFTWFFAGTIAAPTGADASGVFSGQGTSTLIWGNQAETGAGNPLSSLSILGTGGGTTLTSGVETAVQIGSVSWTNTSVFGGGGVWDTILSFAASFDHLGFGLVSDMITAAINVDNTEDEDVNPAINNASGDNPDIITLTSLDLNSLGSTPIDLGGGLTFLGLSAGISQIGQCGTSGVNTAPGSTLVGGVDVWGNCEGNTSVIGISANLRYDEPLAPIPLPAAGWLLLGGVAGLGALRARRRTPKA